MSFGISAQALALACLSFVSINAAAQTAAPPDPPSSAEKTDEKKEAAPPAPVSENLIVTATRSERAVSELPVSAAVVREDHIEHAPVRSVDDLVRGIPGVTPSVISSSGSTMNNQKVSMQGLGGMRALVLLDGVPIHDPYSGIVQWQTVPLDSLRQIEVVRGGNASLYGNFALGGTINLIVRPVEQTNIRANIAHGSGSTSSESLQVDYAFNPVWSMRLDHHKVDSNGFIRSTNPGPIDVDAWTINATDMARFEYRPSDVTAAFVNASIGQNDFSQGTPSTYSKRDMSTVSAGMHHGIGAGSLFTANAYYHKQTEHLVNSTIIGARVDEYVSQKAAIPSSGAGASAEYTVQRTGAFSFFSFGVDVQQVKATEDRLGFARNGTPTQRELVSGKQNFTGIFAQTSWRPNDRTEVLASARYDLFKNEDGADVVAGGATTRYPETTTKELDPRVSIRYALGAQSAVRASVYRAFNAPVLRDLYRNNQSGNSIILGNPNLKPETLVGGEIGGEWAAGPARIELNLFRGVIDGVQSRINVPNTPNTFINQNLGSLRAQGIELTSDFRLSQTLTLDAGYTFVDSQVTEDPDPKLVGKQGIEVPRHYGTLTLRYRGMNGMTVDLRGSSMSRTYIDAGNQVPSPAHRLVDVSVSKEIRPWVDAYVVVENMFDEEYYLALAANSFRRGLPRTITTGLRFDIRPRGRN